MAGPRPVLLVKNSSPFPRGLCKEGKFCDTGGHQLVAHGPKLAHRCILCHLPGFNKFKSTFQEIGIFHIQILGFWFYLDNQAVFFSFFFFLLYWVLVTLWGFSLVAASRGYSSLQWVGFSFRWLLWLRSTGCRCARASAVAALGLSNAVHELNCSEAGRIFLNQGWNPYALHWQADFFFF